MNVEYLAAAGSGEKVTIVIPIKLVDIGFDRMIMAIRDAGAFEWPATYEEAVARMRKGAEPMPCDDPDCSLCSKEPDPDLPLVPPV